VIDLDEVIDLGTPSPSPSPLILPAEDDLGDVPPIQRSPITLDQAEALESEKGTTLLDTLDTGTTHNTFNFTTRPTSPASTTAAQQFDTHPTYPFPIPHLPPETSISIASSPSTHPNAAKPITHLPHLDLLYYDAYLDARTSRAYGEFLRRELPFYRVEYQVTRFGKVVDVRTPRFTVGLFAVFVAVAVAVVVAVFMPLIRNPSSSFSST